MVKSCTLKTGEQEMPYLPQQASACQRQDLHICNCAEDPALTIAKSVSGSANGDL